MMKLCFGKCFGGPSENESSPFSVGKGPGPSGTVIAGFLSSFVSKRSASRGTWDTSATDAQKLRTRPRSDADVVTLATARYLELFAANPRNDETSTILSEVLAAHDSPRSARNAPEALPVSRSSTGQASREPSSRLGAAAAIVATAANRSFRQQYHQQQEQQQLPLSTASPYGGGSGTSTSARFAHRRGASDLSLLGGQEAAGQPALARRGIAGSSSANNLSAQSPFTYKTPGGGLAGSRCRSDRISPSMAAYLIPAPSIRAIARANTELLPTAGLTGFRGLSSSTSFNDLYATPGEGSGAGDCSSGAAVCPRENAAPGQSQPGDGRPDTSTGVVGACGRRSRLYTESSGVAGGGGAASAVRSDLGAAAQQFMQLHNPLTRSPTTVHGGFGIGGGGGPRRPLPRRPSILYSRDGEVTVTGLPPSCLTAGRAPRGRVDVPAAAALRSSMMSRGICSAAAAADVSAPIPHSALYMAGASVDSSSARSSCHFAGGGGCVDGSNGGRPRRNSGGVAPDFASIPAMFLVNRSNDRGSPGLGDGGANTSSGNTNSHSHASVSGLSQNRMQQQQGRQGHRGGGGGGRGRDGAGMRTGVSVSCGANALLVTMDALAAAAVAEAECDRSVRGRCGGHAGVQFEGFPDEDDRGRPPPVSQQQQHECQAQQRQGAEDGEGEGKRGGRMGQRSSSSQEAAGDVKQQQPYHHHQQQQQQQLALANSSSEDGQRCDWGGSSVYAPSRFSDSSRLMHGLTATATPATCSVHSNPLLEPYMTLQPPVAASAATGGTSPPSRFAHVATAAAACGGGPSGFCMASQGLSDAVAAANMDGRGCQVAGAQPAPPPTGPLKWPHGSSMLATEARDVTSALSRLQEACMAAVAQGDLRSMRLCRRISTDVTRQEVTSALVRIGDGGGGGGFHSAYDGSVGDSGGERGSSMGPIRLAAAGMKGGAAGREFGFPRMGPSASLPRATLAAAAAGSAGSFPQQGSGAIGPAGPSAPTASQVCSLTLAFGRLREDAPESMRGEGGGGSAEGEPLVDDAYGGDRPSPECLGIVLDGAMLERARFSVAEDAVGVGSREVAARLAASGLGTGPDASAAQGEIEGRVGAAEDSAEAYQDRVLNVLLRSEFLHDSFDAGAASEEDDEGVLEYRYGGFELGGGDNDGGFSWQASFMEAARKAVTSKAAALAVGLDSGQRGLAPKAAPGTGTSAVGGAAVGGGIGTGFRSAALPVPSVARPGLGAGSGVALQRKGSILAEAAAPLSSAAAR